MPSSCKEVSTVGQVFVANVLYHPDGLQKGSPVQFFFAKDSIYPNELARRKLDGPDDNLFFVDNPVHPKEPAFCTVGCQDKNLTLQIVRIGRPFLKKTIKMIISFCKSESSQWACLPQSGWSVENFSKQIIRMGQYVAIFYFTQYTNPNPKPELFGKTRPKPDPKSKSPTRQGMFMN